MIRELPVEIKTQQRLAVLAALIAIACAAIAYFEHSLLGQILYLVSFVSLLAMLYLVFRLVGTKKENYRYAQRLSVLALHIVISMACVFIRDEQSFAYTLVHSLLDGVLMAYLIYTISNNMVIWSLLAGILMTAMGLMRVEKPIEIIEIAFAIVLLMISSKRLERPIRRVALFLGSLMTIFNLIASFGNYEQTHYLMHLIINLASCSSLIFISDKEMLRILNEKAQCEQETISERSLSKPKISENSDEDMRQKWLCRQYADLSYKELMNAPVHAIKGISESDSLLLRQAFGIQTVGDLADNRYFELALQIVEEARNS